MPKNTTPSPSTAPQPPTLQGQERPEEQTVAMTPKNFRNHPDMENFFRFIYENDLRIEALEIIDQIIMDRKNRRRKGGPVSTANVSHS